jgi:anti-anti-sigma factor
MDPAQNINSQQNGEEFTLTLSGNIDLCQAGPLYEITCKLAANQELKLIEVELSQVERLDAAALQILCAMRREIQSVERQVQFSGMGEELTLRLSQVGITL